MPPDPSRSLRLRRSFRKSVSAYPRSAYTEIFLYLSYLINLIDYFPLLNKLINKILSATALGRNVKILDRPNYYTKHRSSLYATHLKC